MDKKLEKVLVCLYVPAVNRTFDIFVPLDLEIGELTKVLVNGVEYMCNGSYVPSKKEILNLQDPDVLLNPYSNLYSYGVKDGAKLVLI